MKLKNFIYVILIPLFFMGSSQANEADTISGILYRLKQSMINAYDLDYGSVLIEFNAGPDVFDFYRSNRCELVSEKPGFVLDFFQKNLIFAIRALEQGTAHTDNQVEFGLSDVESAVTALKNILPSSSLKACLVEGEHYGYYQFLFFTLDSSEELGVIFVGQPD